MGAQFSTHTPNQNAGPSVNNNILATGVNSTLHNAASHETRNQEEENVDSDGDSDGDNDGNGENHQGEGEQDANEDEDEDDGKRPGRRHSGRSAPTMSPVAPGGSGGRAGRAGRAGRGEGEEGEEGESLWGAPQMLTVMLWWLLVSGVLFIVKVESLIPEYSDLCTWPGDPRSEALALEASSLAQYDGTATKCSSCSDAGLLKKCVRPGCPYALCFQKSNLHPCVKDLGPGEFWCPPCWICRSSTPGRLPYSVVAQGAYLTGKHYTRRPLVFHTIALKLDAYPESLLRCQLLEEFLHCPDMLQLTHIEMVTGAACLPNVRAHVRDALALVKAKPETDLLVCRHYLGPELWKCSQSMVGTKGMVLLACGSAFTNESHFETIKSLVSSGFSKHLLFIIGFTAHSVQPSVVMPFMLRVIIKVYIHHIPVELVLEEEIAHWTLLCHTPVVLVWHRSVQSWAWGYHSQKIRPPRLQLL
ncbi:hypothetical protein BDR07DRAFT_1383381 [Suillus spraguei]|nr:hypothetical protein BDR07DRAFT_1383381 [Suillus spraguei]